MRLKLTAKSVRAIPPPPMGYVLWWDSELMGFGVRVTAHGARSFIAEKRLHGCTRRVSLGVNGSRLAGSMQPILARN